MMSTRLGILELAARQRLDGAALSALWHIARLEAEPPRLIAQLRSGLAYAAALLAGLGLLFILAANWGNMPRGVKFVLLQALVLATCCGASALPRARQPLALLGLLSIGGLFACIGQSYQTGADPWQLFALWSVLALPLALGARSEVVWSAWVIVAMTGVTAWASAQGGQANWWQFSRMNLDTHAHAALMAAGITVLMSKPLQRFSGAGPVAFNLALFLAASALTTVGVIAVFSDEEVKHHALALLVFSVAALLLGRRGLFDVAALSTVSLGLITLLVAAAVRVMWAGLNDGFFLMLSVVGVLALGLLALAVWAILALSRQQRAGGEE